MLILLPSLILLAGALSLILLGKFRQNFASDWLLSTMSLILAAVSLFLLWMQMPVVSILSSWEIPSQSNFVLLLELDQTSWSFALAILSLGLSGLLIPIKQTSLVRRELFFSLFMVSLAVFSVLAGNLTTLALSWMILDLSAFGMYSLELEHIHPRIPTKILITNLVGSVLLAMLAALSTSSGQESFAELGSPAPMAWLALGAILIRLRSSLLAMQIEIPSSPTNYFVRLFPFGYAATALVLGVRLANSLAGVEIPYGYQITLTLVALLLLMKSLRLEKSNQHAGYWIGLGATLSISSAMGNVPNVPLAWGLASLCLAWFSIFARSNSRFSIGLSVILVLLFCMLNPGTIDFGADGLEPPNLAWQISQILIHGLFVFTFYKKTIFSADPPLNTPNKASVGLGMAIPGVFLSLWLFFSLDLLPPDSSSIAGWVPPYIFGLLVLSAIIYRADFRLLAIFASALDASLSPGWILRSISKADRGLMAITNTITELLEGEGGVLWALLLVALLVSLISQMPGGS